MARCGRSWNTCMRLPRRETSPARAKDLSLNAARLFRLTGQRHVSSYDSTPVGVQAALIHSLPSGFEFEQHKLRRGPSRTPTSTAVDFSRCSRIEVEERWLNLRQRSPNHSSRCRHRSKEGSVVREGRYRFRHNSGCGRSCGSWQLSPGQF